MGKEGDLLLIRRLGFRFSAYGIITIQVMHEEHPEGGILSDG